MPRYLSIPLFRMPVKVARSRVTCGMLLGAVDISNLATNAAAAARHRLTVKESIMMVMRKLAGPKYEPLYCFSFHAAQRTSANHPS